jgi:hypothetical protein
MESKPTPPTNWGLYVLEAYGSRKPPVTGTVDIDKLEGRARDVLKDHHG